MAAMIFLICIFFYELIRVGSLPPTSNYSAPINIGIAVDDNSVKDILVLINSIIISSYKPEDVKFFIVACGVDQKAADDLKIIISEALINCFHPESYPINCVIKAFILPRDSGFYLQMVNTKVKSHWYSPTGADMARFFLPKLFPYLDRILYLDNDIIVSCCLEEIWSSTMQQHQIVGIVLDELKWATITQFQRHYNASHALVIKNMRRNSINHVDPVTDKEFHGALPSYPNDGVLLIDVQKYNSMKIFEAIDEIAMANGRGEYVVGVGTQQFTVLGLHDRWLELTPRANIRHFPDMARGFLMWFLYNGIIHYAGASKPRHVCSADGNVANEHRVQTYTPWAVNIMHIFNRCPAENLYQPSMCYNTIPIPDTFENFLYIINKVVQSTRDPSLLYLKIGGSIHDDMTRETYASSLNCFPNNYNETFGERCHVHYSNLITTIDRYILHNSSWGARLFNYDENTASQNALILNNVKYPRDSTIDTEYLKDIKRRPLHRNKQAKSLVKHNKEVSSRIWLSQQLTYCAYSSPVIPGMNRSFFNNFSNCSSILLEIKEQQKKHWDVMAIAIDEIKNSTEFYPSSLSILRALDLEFMRPRFILTRIFSLIDLQESMQILVRNGFIPSHRCDSITGYCNIWATRVNIYDIR